MGLKLSDKERIHRWITQADLERMLDDARREGAEAMRESAASMLQDRESGWMSVAEMVKAVRAMPASKGKP